MHPMMRPRRASGSSSDHAGCICNATHVAFALQVLMPQLEALNADITVLSADTDSERRKQEAASREVAELRDKLQQVGRSISKCNGRHSRSSSSYSSPSDVV